VSIQNVQDIASTQLALPSGLYI